MVLLLGFSRPAIEYIAAKEIMRGLHIEPQLSLPTPFNVEFILSGLLRSEARDIRYILNTIGVNTIREWHRDDIWFTFYAEPSGS